MDEEKDRAKEEASGDGAPEDGKRPRRVALAPVPRNSRKMNRMPDDLKKELDRLLGEGTVHSSRQLAKWLADNGFAISHMTIYRYGQKFERRLEAVRLATEQARVVCETFKDDDQQMQTALLRLVQTRVFEVLQAANERPTGRAKAGAVSLTPVNISVLARTVSGLVRAEVEHLKWKERTRAMLAAAESKLNEARSQGLSEAMADSIRSVLLDIENPGIGG
jgi:hypothetical protein